MRNEYRIKYSVLKSTISYIRYWNCHAELVEASKIETLRQAQGDKTFNIWKKNIILTNFA